MKKLDTILRWGVILAIPLLGAGSCAPMYSDRRLKRNITKVGVLDGDIDLYRYQYLWSDEVFVGVMAQDLIDTRPDAVVLRPDNHFAVDYAKLGTRLQTWDEWRAAQ